MPNNIDDRYVALIRNSAIRDAQVCKNAEWDPMDDDSWYDIESPEIYLGLFSGPDALKRAAEYACTVPENIRLVPIRAYLQ